MLRDNKIHYAGVITELSFTQDPSIAFPKIEFNYVGSLNDAEARVIIEMRGHEQVDRILQSKMVPAEMEAPADGGSASTRATPAPPRPAAGHATQEPRPLRQSPPRPSVVRPPVPQQARSRTPHSRRRRHPRPARPSRQSRGWVRHAAAVKA